MTGRLRDKIVLVAGPAGRIGTAVTDAIAAAGGMAITAGPDGPPAARHALDVTREADWRTLMDRIASDHGRLDALVLIAAVARAATSRKRMWRSGGGHRRRGAGPVPGHQSGLGDAWRRRRVGGERGARRPA